MNGAVIIAAADRIEQAANDLAAAYGELTAELDVARKEAFAVGGVAGTSDVNNVADPSRVAEEVARYLVTAGLKDLVGVSLAAATSSPLKDLAGLWADRVAMGKLETSRRDNVPKRFGTSATVRAAGSRGRPA